MDDAVVLDYGSDALRAGWSNSFPSPVEPRVVSCAQGRQACHKLSDFLIY